MKELVRAVPDVTVVAHAQLRLKMCAEARPHLAVYAVRADEQVALGGESLRLVRFHAKAQVNTQLCAPRLQDVQQLDPRDARKLIAANRDPPPAMHDINVVPRRKCTGDGLIRWLVRVAQIRERLIREDHAPTERI